MKIKGQYKECRVSSSRAWSTRRSWLAVLLVGITGVQATARAGRTHSEPIYDPSTYYSALPTTGEETINKQADMLIYACFYELTETVLKINFGKLHNVALVVELPEHTAGATVYVTEDGVWVETLELHSDRFTYVLIPGAEVEFEIAARARSAGPNRPRVDHEADHRRPRARVSQA